MSLSAEQPSTQADSKSGICTPAGYNGKDPKGGLEAPVKVYPGSSSIGKGASKSGGSISGPASGSRTR